MKKQKKIKKVANVLPKVRRPAIGWESAQMIPTGIPSITSKSDSIIVRNREIIQSLSASAVTGVIAAFGTSNPLAFGASTAFPSTTWLYGLANLYDKFIVKKFRLIYQPVVPVTTAGTVAVWFDSDPTSTGAPTGYTDVSGNMNAKTASVYAPIEMDLRPDQLNRLPQYLTLLGGVAVSNLTGSPGVLKWASSAVTVSSGVTGTVSIGYLWADYEVQFLNPTNSGT